MDASKKPKKWDGSQWRKPCQHTYLTCQIRSPCLWWGQLQEPSEPASALHTWSILILCPLGRILDLNLPLDVIWILNSRQKDFVSHLDLCFSLSNNCRHTLDLRSFECGWNLENSNAACDEGMVCVYDETLRDTSFPTPFAPSTKFPGNST